MMDYTLSMSDVIWIVLAGGIAIVLYRLGVRWWRSHRAGKDADALLHDIVKGKDAFRR